MHWTRDCASVSIEHHWPAPVTRSVKPRVIFHIIAKRHLMNEDQRTIAELRTRVEGIVRLTGGVILNLVLWLWPAPGGASVPGGAYHDFSHALFYGVLAAAAVSFIAPTIWHGARWQRAGALGLLCLPSVILFRVAQFIVGIL